MNWQKTEDLSKLSLLTQSNSFWKAARIKKKALAHLDKQLKEMLHLLGSVE